jgi:hypothetical protein
MKMHVIESANSYSRMIPPGEASFHPHSFADTDGRLFWWKGELYRGISSEKTQFFARLFDEGVIEDLVERGLLIETQPTSYSIGCYPMVVRHKTVPFASYPNEWCPAMLKDAALTILEIEGDLIGRRLTLKDGHPWNMLFDSFRPVFVDLTSIVPVRDEHSWPAYDEFCRFCFYPLILMSQGQDRIARSLLPVYEGVRRSEVSALVHSYAPSAFLLSKLIRRGLKPVRGLLQRDGRQSQSRLIEQMKRDIERLGLPSHRPVTAQDAGTPKLGAVQAILSRLKPDTVLDISDEAGTYSKQAAMLAKRVVSFDADPDRANRLYYEAQQEGLPILPLVLDFIHPTPSAGYSSHYSIAATERFRCDLVLAMGLVRRLAI